MITLHISYNIIALPFLHHLADDPDLRLWIALHLFVILADKIVVIKETQVSGV